MPLSLRFRRRSLTPAAPRQHLLAATCKVLAAEQEAPKEDFRLDPVDNDLCKSCFDVIDRISSIRKIT